MAMGSFTPKRVQRSSLLIFVRCAGRLVTARRLLWNHCRSREANLASSSRPMSPCSAVVTTHDLQIWTRVREPRTERLRMHRLSWHSRRRASSAQPCGLLACQR